MGQYYKPVSFSRKQGLYSHDYGNGLKLMEHSWIGNDFVGAVMRLLSPANPWHKTRFAWIGDYCDRFEKEREDAIMLDGGIDPADPSFRYVVNFTKREFVDLLKADKPSHDWDGTPWFVHPLPILTASGNGQGGGDYEGSRMEDVGRWAGDVISVEDDPPDGFTEIDAVFIEG